MNLRISKPQFEYLTSLWTTRLESIKNKRESEKEVDAVNAKMGNEIARILHPIAKQYSTPFEVVIEANRISLVQYPTYTIKCGKVYQWRISQNLPPLREYLASDASIRQLQRDVVRWIKRTRTIIKPHTSTKMNPMAKFKAALGPDVRQVLVSINTRTKYDF